MAREADLRQGKPSEKRRQLAVRLSGIRTPSCADTRIARGVQGIVLIRAIHDRCAAGAQSRGRPLVFTEGVPARLRAGISRKARLARASKEQAIVGRGDAAKDRIMGRGRCAG